MYVSICGRCKEQFEFEPADGFLKIMHVPVKWHGPPSILLCPSCTEKFWEWMEASDG